MKYDYGELWRWGVILDRFVLSAGNTIGITAAGVSTNQGARPEPVVWLNGLRDAGVEESSAAANGRETIRGGARDPQRVADALPTLLPRLGIPVDAVGIVAYDWRLVPSISVPGGSSQGRARVSSDGEQGGVPVWVIVLASALGVVVVPVPLLIRVLRRGGQAQAHPQGG